MSLRTFIKEKYKRYYPKLRVEESALDEIEGIVDSILKCYAKLLKPGDVKIGRATWAILGEKSPMNSFVSERSLTAVVFDHAYHVVDAKHAKKNGVKGVIPQSHVSQVLKDVLNDVPNEASLSTRPYKTLFIAGVLDVIVSELCELSGTEAHLNMKPATAASVKKAVSGDSGLKAVVNAVKKCTPVPHEVVRRAKDDAARREARKAALKSPSPKAKSPSPKSSSSKTCQAKKADGHRCTNAAKYKDKTDDKAKCGVHCKSSNRRAL